MRRWIALVVLVACGSPRATEPLEASRRPEPAPARQRPRHVITETQVEVLDDISFLSGSATLAPRSMRSIEALAQTLTGNPSIRLVAVHAFGSDALPQFQAELGAARARAIVDQLVARGVERGRLVPTGAATPRAGASMRPVFEILQRSP